MVREKILVIEDNPINLELMVYLLQAFDYQVFTAKDGNQGLDLAQGELPDLIICDVQLPGLDGYDVARCLKEEDKLNDIPLVAVTALAMVGDREKLLAAGFDYYISKPIQPEQFLASIQQVLTPRSQVQSLVEERRG